MARTRKRKRAEVESESEEEESESDKPLKKKPKLTRRMSSMDTDFADTFSKSPTKGSKPLSKASTHVPDMEPEEIKKQKKLGPQSSRGKFKGKIDFGPAINGDSHGLKCFQKMYENEKKLCGEFAVFYHSYSLAALLYEVQASVAAVLFRFRSQYTSLPRLLKSHFDEIPDAPTLMELFPSFGTDHNKKMRGVCICASTSLVAQDPEATPKDIFLMGYSCSDVEFTKILENLLKSCGVAKKKCKGLAKKIIAVSEKHGLDVSQFKGRACVSGRAGHLLQIFVKRTILDKYLYPAFPYGYIDEARLPLEDYMNGSGKFPPESKKKKKPVAKEKKKKGKKGKKTKKKKTGFGMFGGGFGGCYKPGPQNCINGQVRIVVHPSAFMRANAVRMYSFSADKVFHDNRVQFQKELTELLEPILGDPETRTKAVKGIYGCVPNWYQADNQVSIAKKTNKLSPCRYGSYCFLKTANHISQFSHPPDCDDEDDCDDFSFEHRDKIRHPRPKTWCSDRSCTNYESEHQFTIRHGAKYARGSKGKCRDAEDCEESDDEHKFLYFH